MKDCAMECSLQILLTEIKSYQKQMEKIQLISAVEIGQRLIKAKSLVPYGEWGNWLKDYVSYSQVTAGRYMKIAEEYKSVLDTPADGQEYSAMKNLSFTQALILLDVPEEERAEFIAELDPDNLSVRLMQQAVKEREQIRQEKAELEQRNAELEKAIEGEKEKVSKLQKEHDNLKNKANELEKSKQALQMDVAHSKAEIGKLQEKQLYKNNQKLRSELTAAQIKNATHKVAFRFESMERVFKELTYELNLLAKLDKEVHGEYQKKLRKFLLKCLDDGLGEI